MLITSMYTGLIQTSRLIEGNRIINNANYTIVIIIISIIKSNSKYFLNLEHAFSSTIQRLCIISFLRRKNGVKVIEMILT